MVEMNAHEILLTHLAGFGGSGQKTAEDSYKYGSEQVDSELAGEQSAS
jgi:hypothetical protein